LAGEGKVVKSVGTDDEEDSVNSMAQMAFEEIQAAPDTIILERLIPVDVRELELQSLKDPGSIRLIFRKQRIQNAITFCTIVFLLLGLGMPLPIFTPASVFFAGLLLLSADAAGSRRLERFEAWLRENTHTTFRFAAFAFKKRFRLSYHPFSWSRSVAIFQLIYSALLQFVTGVGIALDQINLYAVLGFVVVLREPVDDIQWGVGSEREYLEKLNLASRKNTGLVIGAGILPFALPTLGQFIELPQFLAFAGFGDNRNAYFVHLLPLFLLFNGHVSYEACAPNKRAMTVAWFAWLLGGMLFFSVQLLINGIVYLVVGLRSLALYAFLYSCKQWLPGLSALRLAGAGLLLLYWFVFR
jgi:hypothetical protein